MIKIKDKTNCSGCEACMNICPKNCISMQKDEYDLYYPKVNIEECINCGLCEKVCPILNKKDMNYDNSKVFGMYNKDKDILKKSSSGGVFYSLAKEIINKGGVVYGVDFDLQFKRAKELKELEPLLKSKYLQAKNLPYKKILEDLNKGLLVLVSGTPCQIAGIRNYIKDDYKNLYTVSFVCEGVPSPIVYNILIKHYEKKYKSKVRKVTFRNKKYGWAYSVYLLIEFKNGKFKTIHLPENPYLNLFLSMKTARPSCLDCKFRGINGNSDIILSDFWNVRKSKNTKYNFYGVSQVLFNEKGLELYEKIKDEFIVYESSLDEMKKLSDMFTNKNIEEIDNSFLLELKEKDNEEAYKYLMENYALSKKDILKHKIKIFLAKIKYTIIEKYDILKKCFNKK